MACVPLTEDTGQSILPSTSASNSNLLLDLPDLVRENVLNCLGLFSLLRLRQVCRKTLHWLHDNKKLKEHLDLLPIHVKSLSALHDLNSRVVDLPLTTVSLSIHDIEASAAYPAFARKFGPTIENLTIEGMNFCITDTELKFLNCFTNLTSFKITSIYTRSWQTDTNELNLNRVPIECLKNLKFLLFENCFIHVYPYLMLKECPSLKKFLIGYRKFGNVRCTHFAQSDFYEHMSEYLKRKPSGSGFIIEFSSSNSFPIFDIMSKGVGRFIREMLRVGVTMIGVHSSVISNMYTHLLRRIPQKAQDALTFKFHSIIGLTPEILRVKLPSVTRIFCPNMPVRNGIGCSGWEWKFGRSDLPNLKEIHLNLQPPGSEIQNNPISVNQDGLKNLLDFVIGTSKPTVEDLSVTLWIHRLDVEQIMFLQPENLAANFPNLKKLSLNHDSFQYSDYKRLFTLLGNHTRLHTLTLTIPKNIDRFAIPLTILELKCLKELVIEPLEIVTQSALTDTDFIVLSAMALEVFRFGPEKDVGTLAACLLHQVTEIGLRALLHGYIGRAIQNITINGHAACCRSNLEIKRALFALKIHVTLRNAFKY